MPYYYYAVMDLSPRTLEPDRLSLYPPDEFQETFVLEQVQNDKYTITDGTRIMDLHLVQGNPHAVGMLMVHLQGEAAGRSQSLQSSSRKRAAPDDGVRRQHEPVQQRAAAEAGRRPNRPDIHGRLCSLGGFREDRQLRENELTESLRSSKVEGRSKIWATSCFALAEFHP